MEVWKDIKGYQGLYKLSDTGLVKSFKKSRYGKILKPYLSKRGYFVINLYSNFYYKTYTIHRLIGIHFILNPYNKPQINHKNGMKTDNNIKNLEWATSSENNQHAYDTDLKKGSWLGKFGVDNKSSKAIYQLSLDGNRIKIWANAYEVERQIGINMSSVNNVLRSRSKTAGNYKWEYV